jgi:hypothetical protein
MRFLTRKKPGPILFALAAAAAVATIPAVASASTQASPVVGHVYVNDNTAGTNTIGAFNRVHSGVSESCGFRLRQPRLVAAATACRRGRR